MECNMHIYYIRLSTNFSTIKHIETLTFPQTVDPLVRRQSTEASWWRHNRTAWKISAVLYLSTLDHCCLKATFPNQTHEMLLSDQFLCNSRPSLQSITPSVNKLEPEDGLVKVSQSQIHNQAKMKNLDQPVDQHRKIIFLLLSTFSFEPKQVLLQPKCGIIKVNSRQ